MLSLLKPGTLCYVKPTCRASPAARRAVGGIVEVVAGPYQRVHGTRRAHCYDVRHGDLVFYCQSDKLCAISDPDADVGEAHGGTLMN